MHQGDGRVETLLITGLPGSGKSTLLTQAFKTLPETARVAVCAHHNAKAFGLETTSFDVQDVRCSHYSEVFDFGSGCICCSPDGDLTRLLVDLGARREQLGLTHCLVETTGIADTTSFIRLFRVEPCIRNNFILRGVCCVIDMARGEELLRKPDAIEPTNTEQPPSVKGISQVANSDVIVLNKSDEVQESEVTARTQSLRGIVSRCASDSKKTHEVAPPVILGPYSFAQKVSFADLAVASETPAVADGETCNEGEGNSGYAGPFSGFSDAPFGFGEMPSLISMSHDMTYSTACLMLPRGGVYLDAALGMLQMLLDSGEALRVQGYLSFLPDGDEDLKCNSFPRLERTWGLPMVVVDGLYRDQLKVKPVLLAAKPGFCSEEENFQDTAVDSAASDRGGVKVFICGRGLSEEKLFSQLQGTTVPGGRRGGWKGPLCDLDHVFPEAAQTLGRLNNAVEGAFEAASAAACKVEGNSPGSLECDTDLSTIRKQAHAFSQGLVQEILARVPSESLCPSNGSFTAELSSNSCGDLVLHWVDGIVRAERCNGSEHSVATRVVGSQVYIKDES